MKSLLDQLSRTAVVRKLTSGAFWSDALERAFHNAWQHITALSLVVSGMVLTDIDWVTLAGIGLAAGGASLIVSIVSLPGDGAEVPVWQAALWRGIRTFGTSIATVLGAEQVNAFDLDWAHVLSVAAVATLLSFGKNYVNPPRETIPTVTVRFAASGEASQSAPAATNTVVRVATKPASRAPAAATSKTGRPAATKFKRV